MAVETQEKSARTGTSADALHEFQDLISGCGVYRLDRALIALTGSDRVRWLNGMVTNNVRDLASGSGVYAFLLNPQGKIQADLHAFNRDNELIVETDSAQVEKVLSIFDHYIIMDDVEVENRAGRVAVIGLAGPSSAKLLNDLGLCNDHLQPLHFRNVSWHGHALTIVSADNPAVANYELWIGTDGVKELRDALLQAGAAEVHEETLEILRVAGGTPKYGQDIRDRDLPQETGQDQALNFNKGCYIGQEIVERVRSRGAVHRMFAGFEIEGNPPALGTKIQSDGKDVGEITSVAAIPTKGGERTIALGYLRKEFATKELTASETRLRVAKLPFAEFLNN